MMMEEMRMENTLMGLPRDSISFQSFLVSRDINYQDFCENVFTSIPESAGLTTDYINTTGGLMSALSLRSAEILQTLIEGIQTTTFEKEKVNQLKYLLMHKNPHIDEYFAGLIFRACLPEKQRNIEHGEIVLTSAHDDLIAKAQWPHAAVLGIGGTHTGGAQALYLFDEHAIDGKAKKVNSLALLMKQRMFGSQQVPYPLYILLYEVNHIDAYGGAHPKNLSSYIKRLHDTPLMLSGEEPEDPNSFIFMDPTWKTGIIDACVVALLGRSQVQYPKSEWLPALEASLRDFQNRTVLKADPLFNDAYSKVKQNLTHVFQLHLQNNSTCLTVPTAQGLREPQKSNGRVAFQTMLMPYLPLLCNRYWGPELTRVILLPFWETRVFAEILSIRGRRQLQQVFAARKKNNVSVPLTIGVLTFSSCPPSSSMLVADADPIPDTWILDLAAAPGITSPGTLNHFVNRTNAGYGYTIFRSKISDTIILTKGAAIEAAEWNAVCETLLQTEGSSSMQENIIGCWHIVQNEKGYAGFALNGNPSHQYVPRSMIDAQWLLSLLCSLRRKD